MKTDKSHDLLIVNARVLTMDKAHPRADAVLLTGGKIAAVGTRAEVTAMAGADARLIDAGGRTLLPGFVESHLHIGLGGAELVLTPKEWDLLLFFAEHPGRAFSRGELLETVWGYGHDGYDHTVNTHINRLRAKIGDDRNEHRFIHTVWGTGYRFEPRE